jgi:uncharacterized protein (DUF2141 family)
MTHRTALASPAVLLLATSLLAACSHLPTNAPTSEPTPAAACMQLQVHKLQAGKGPLLAAAYGSADTFMKSPTWLGQSPAASEQASLQVCGVTTPDIAFTVFQDLNGNGKLDMNPMGIPTEPYGMSGRPVFGPPRWDSAKVSAGAGRTVRIEL